MSKRLVHTIFQLWQQLVPRKGNYFLQQSDILLVKRCSHYPVVICWLMIRSTILKIIDVCFTLLSRDFSILWIEAARAASFSFLSLPTWAILVLKAASTNQSIICLHIKFVYILSHVKDIAWYWHSLSAWRRCTSQHGRLHRWRQELRDPREGRPWWLSTRLQPGYKKSQWHPDWLIGQNKRTAMWKWWLVQPSA